MNDKFLKSRNSYERLLEEYHKYKSLIIAFDFDGTVYDYHKEGLQFHKMIRTLRVCREAGFMLVCFTANPDEAYVRDYLIEQNIPFDCINETPEPVRSLIPLNPRKIYYNLLLDDRAGLGEAYRQLNTLLKEIAPTQSKAS